MNRKIAALTLRALPEAEALAASPIHRMTSQGASSRSTQRRQLASEEATSPRVGAGVSIRFRHGPPVFMNDGYAETVQLPWNL